jgi:hypothetical protein
MLIVSVNSTDDLFKFSVVSSTTCHFLLTVGVSSTDCLLMLTISVSRQAFSLYYINADVSSTDCLFYVDCWCNFDKLSPLNMLLVGDNLDRLSLNVVCCCFNRLSQC